MLRRSCNIFKKNSRSVTGLLLTVSLYGCATSEIKSGYNALETAVTNERSVRSRLLVNEDLHAENISIGYHALAELDNLDPNTHFGRHGLTVGMDDIDVQGITVLKTANDGITDSKYGIRLRNFGKLGGYGFVDMTVDHDSFNLSVFYGRQMGETFSAEVYEAAEFSFDGRPTSYTEIQINRTIGSTISIFTRGETANFGLDDAKILVGAAIKF